MPRPVWQMIQAPLFGLSAADKNTQCQMASAITDEFDTIEILSIIIVTNRATGESNTKHDSWRSYGASHTWQRLKLKLEHLILLTSYDYKF